MKRLVEMVRARADVPRVRSSEVRKILEALHALAEEGAAKLFTEQPT